MNKHERSTDTIVESQALSRRSRVISQEYREAAGQRSSARDSCPMITKQRLLSILEDAIRMIEDFDDDIQPLQRPSNKGRL
jgi:hypothetical protein